MLKYLVIILDDTAVSYCHYNNTYSNNRLISIDDLQTAIFYAMKENLMINFVYPDYILPLEYKMLINSIDHCDIVSSICRDKPLLDNANIIVLRNWTEIKEYPFKDDATYVFRTSKNELFTMHKLINDVLTKVKRLNIVITDIEDFKEEDYDNYRIVLTSLSQQIERLYLGGQHTQLNLLSDRMMLDRMNNCNAGWESITLAPDGRFYICPAFYNANKIDGKESSIAEECEKGYSIGTLNSGLDIKNAQLYKIDHAKLCCNCDAYQCKRCIWLNRKTTCEVNTPSHEQCVVAHLERNASRRLLKNLRNSVNFLQNKNEIKEISYLDPFEVIEKL